MAALGGFLLAPYSGVIFAEMGMQYAILNFYSSNYRWIRSVQGSAIASLIVGLAGLLQRILYQIYHLQLIC